MKACIFLIALLWFIPLKVSEINDRLKRGKTEKSFSIDGIYDLSFRVILLIIFLSSLPFCKTT